MELTPPEDSDPAIDFWAVYTALLSEAINAISRQCVPSWNQGGDTTLGHCHQVLQPAGSIQIHRVSDEHLLCESQDKMRGTMLSSLNVVFINVRQ